MKRREIKRDIREKDWTGFDDWMDMGEKVSGRWQCYSVTEKYSKKWKSGRLKKMGVEFRRGP